MQDKNITTIQKIKMWGTRFLVFALLISLAFAQNTGLFTTKNANAANGVPKIINFQGKITKTSDGTNVTNGNYDVVFKIYSVSSGGTALWTETWNSGTSQVTLTNGVFTAKLGTYSDLSTVDFTTDTLYLGVNFNSDGEMTPRKQLTAAPYALNSNNLVGDGRIGITYTGTSTPAANITFNPSASTTSPAVTITAGSNVTGAGLRVTQNGSGYAAILTGGNVGIGSTTASSTLFIQGSGSTNPFKIASSTGTNMVAVEPTGLVGIGNGYTSDSNFKVAIKASTSGIRIDGATSYAFWASNGSVVASSFNVTGTEWNKLYRTSTSFQIQSPDDISFSTGSNSTPVVLGVFKSSGNFGIGTTSPTATLFVQGTSTAPTTNPLVIASSSGASLFTFTPTGNLGIGTSTPGRTLTVVGDIRATGGIYDSNNSAGSNGYVLQTTGSATQWVATSTLGFASAGSFSGTNGYVARWTSASALTSGTVLDNGTVAGINATSSSYSFNVQGAAGVAPLNVSSSTGTSLLTVLGNGNVGIGTTGPDSLLSLSGGNVNVHLQGNGNANIFLDAGSATQARGIRMGYTGGNINFSIGQNSVTGATKLGFFNNDYTGGNTPAWVMDTNGNLGIGTTTPISKLHVVGGAITLDDNQKLQSVNSVGNISNIAYLDNNNYLNIGGSNSNGTYIFGGSTQALNVASTGNVGIGTTTPAKALQVYSSSGTAIRLTDTSINAQGFELYPTTGASAHGFSIYDASAGATRLSINSSGNVGIGTTTPGRTFVVVGDIRATGILYDSNNSAGTSGNFLMTTGTGYQWTSTSTLFGGNQVTGNGTNGYVTRWTAANTISTGVLLDNGTVAGVNATSSTYTFNVQGSSGVAPLNVSSSSGTSLLTVLGNGNVGINSSSPYTNLVVKGTNSNYTAFDLGANDSILRLNKNSIGNYNGIDFSYGVGATNLWKIGYFGGTPSTSDVTFYDNGTPRFTFQTGGNLGIGTTTAGRTLTVVGDIRATGILYDSNNSAGTSGNFLMTTGTGYQWTSTSTLFGSSLHTGSGTNGYVARWTGTTALGNGIILDNGTVAGVNATSSTYSFNVQGAAGTAPFNVASSSGTSLLTVTAAGNVGIGSATPGARLVLSTDGASVRQLQLEDTHSGGKNWAITSGSTGANAPGTGNFGLYDITANAFPLAILQSSGNVGIGTTTPLAKLEVVGAAQIDGTLQVRSSTGGGNFNITDNGAGTATINNSGNSVLNISSASYTNFTSGNVGIGANPSSFALQTAGHVGPNADALYDLGSASLRWNNLYLAGNATIGNSVTRSLTRTISTTVNDVVDVGSFTLSNGGGSLWVSITVPSGGYSVAKQYLIPIQYNQNTGTWQTVLPSNSTGAYSGHDFALEIRVANNVAYLRIRTVASGGSAGTAYVTIRQEGVATDTFTASTATTSTSTLASIFSSTALTQYGSNVGIGTSTASYALDIQPSTSNNVVLNVRNYVGTNLLTLTGSSPSLVMSTSGYGIFYGSAITGARMGATADANTSIPFVARGTTAQTADILQARTVADAVLFNVTASGNVGVGTTTPLATLFVAGTTTAGTVNPFAVASSTGTQLLTVTTGGNVGIGTTNPLQSLHVKNSGSGAIAIIENATGYGGLGFDTNGMYMQPTTASKGVFFYPTTGANGYFGIASTGNVGVATTTPGQKFVVVGDMRATGALYDSTNAAGSNGNFLMSTATGYAWTATSTLFGSNLHTGSGTNGYVARWTGTTALGNGIILDNGTVAGVNATSSTIAFNIQGTSSLDPLQAGTSTNTGMFIVKGNTGNVGIGTNSPGAKLHIVENSANISIGNVSGCGSNYGGIAFANSFTACSNYSLLGDGTNTYVNRASGGDLFFREANSTQMVIKTSSGNVGVGTASPLSLLDVAGTAQLHGSGSNIGLYVNSSGNIGINTTTQSSLLTLNQGTLQITGSSQVAPSSGVGMELFYNGSSSYLFSYDRANSAYKPFEVRGSTINLNGSNAAGGIGLYVNASNQVGINTTTPQATFDVQGTQVVGNAATLTGQITVYGQGSRGSFRAISATGNKGYNLASSNYEFKIEQPGDVNYIRIRKDDTQSSEIIRFQGDGNVGIGTSSPTATLFVSGTTTAGTINPFVVASSTGTQLLTVTTAGNVGIGTSAPLSLLDVAGTAQLHGSGSTVGLYINSSGNVGIGTTTPGNNLSVVGVINATTGFRISNAATSGNYLRGDGTNFVSAAIQAADVPTLNQNTTGSAYYLTSRDTRATNDLPQDYGPLVKFDFKQNSTNSFPDGGTYNGVMTWRSYGTSTDLSGGPVLQLGYGSAGNMYSRISTGTGTWASWIQILNGNTGVQLQTSTPGTQQTGHLSISGSGLFGGNVGIGTTTPGRTLSVVGDIRATGILYDSTNSAGTSGNFLMTTGTGYQWTSTSTLFGSSLHTGSGTNGYVTRWTGSASQSTGILLDDGTVAGVSATSSTIAFNIQGTSSLDPLQVGTSTNTGMLIVKGNTGRVGVGTSAPLSLFDVAGTAQLHGSGSTAGLLVNSVGNVGIGTNSPLTALHVYGIRHDISAANPNYTLPIMRMESSSTAVLDFGSNQTSPFGQWIQSWDRTNGGTTYPLLLNPVGGNIGIGTSAPLSLLDVAGTAQLHGSGTNVGLVVNSNGNVGIGSTAPIQKLDVAGNANIIGTNADGSVTTPTLNVNGAFMTIGDYVSGQTFTNGLGIKFNDSGTAHASIRFASASTTPRFDICASGSNSYLSCSTGSETMSILVPNGSMGSVGIGTTTPGGQLSVKASGSNVGLIVTGSNGAANLQQWYSSGNVLRAAIGDDGAFGINDGSKLYLDGPGLNGITYFQESNGINFVAGASRNIYFNAGGSNRLYVDNGGNVGIGTTSPLAMMHILTNNAANKGLIIQATTSQSANLLELQNSTGQTISTVSSDGKTWNLSGNTNDGITLTLRNLVTTDSGGTATVTNNGGGGYIIKQVNSYIGFNTGTSGTNERLRIDNVGNIGVGTSTPLASLQITGTAINDTSANINITRGLYISPNPTNAANTLQATDYRGFETSGYTLVLASTTAISQVYGTLHNQITVNTTTVATLANASNVYINGAPKSTSNLTITSSTALTVIGGTVSTTTNAYGLFLTAPTGATNNYAAILNGGNVGIGTSAPNSTLSVVGDIASTGFFKSPNTTYYFNPNTGYFNISNGYISNIYGADSVLRLVNGSGITYFPSTAGNIGIASTAPTAMLAIQGVSGSTTDLLNIASSTAVSQFIVKSSGNVGIGTGTPGAKAHVYEPSSSATLTQFTQNTAYAGLLVDTTYSSGNYTPGLFWQTSNQNSGKPKAGIWTYADGNGSSMYFGTSNAYATGVTNNGLVIDPSGNVGIGTTSPGSLMQVAGALRLGVASTTTGTLILHTSSNGYTTTLRASSTGTSSLTFTLPNSNGTSGQVLTTDGAGGLYWSTASGSSQWTTAGSDIYYTTGKVLIGTTTTTGTLTVQAAAGVTPFSVSSSSGLSFLNLTTTGNLGIGTTTPLTKLAVVGTAGNNDILDIASSTGLSILRVTATGNVGIGTSSPVATFAVNGTSYHTATSTFLGTIVGSGATSSVASAIVTGLNADYLDGYDSSAFGDATLANQKLIMGKTSSLLGLPKFAGDGSDGAGPSSGTLTSAVKQYSSWTLTGPITASEAAPTGLFIAVSGTLSLGSAGSISVVGKGRLGGNTGAFTTGQDCTGTAATYPEACTTGAGAGGGGGNYGGVGDIYNNSWPGGNGGNGGGAATTGGNRGVADTSNGSGPSALAQLDSTARKLSRLNTLLTNSNAYTLATSQTASNAWVVPLGAGGGYGGAGGHGYDGSGGATGGSGGANNNGGNGGGIIYIEADTISTSSTTPVIKADGAAGANGGNGGNASGCAGDNAGGGSGAGGSGGGGGGFVWIRAKSLSGINTTTVTASGGAGGSGGSGGTGCGTGSAGTAGKAGGTGGAGFVLIEQVY